MWWQRVYLAEMPKKKRREGNQYLPSNLGKYDTMLDDTMRNKVRQIFFLLKSSC